MALERSSFGNWPRQENQLNEIKDPVIGWLCWLEHVNTLRNGWSLSLGAMVLRTCNYNALWYVERLNPGLDWRNASEKHSFTPFRQWFSSTVWSGLGPYTAGIFSVSFNRIGWVKHPDPLTFVGSWSKMLIGHPHPHYDVSPLHTRKYKMTGISYSNS